MLVARIRVAVSRYALLSWIPLQAATCYVLDVRIREVVQQTRDLLRTVELIATSLNDTRVRLSEGSCMGCWWAGGSVPSGILREAGVAKLARAAAARSTLRVLSAEGARPSPLFPGLPQEQDLPFRASMLKQQSDMAAALVGECCRPGRCSSRLCCL